jgi:hypothetical protein
MAKQVREVRGAFYNSPRESGHWGVRDLDMSGQGYWNPGSKPDKSGWDLAAEKLKQAGHVQSRSQTCLIEVTRTWLLAQLSSVRLTIRRGPDMSGLGAGHMKFWFLESDQKPRYVWFSRRIGLLIDFNN